MTAEPVVISVPPGTARLYLPDISQGSDEHPFGLPPERVWVGVPELPTVERFRDFAGSTVSAGFGSLGRGDPVVLAEPCPDSAEGGCVAGLIEWDVIGKTGDYESRGMECPTCHGESVVPLVSGRVADDDQPAIVPVGEDLDGSPDPTRPGRFVTTYVDHDGTLWSEIGDDMDMIEALPGDWSGMSWAVRVAGAEDTRDETSTVAGRIV